MSDNQQPDGDFVPSELPGITASEIPGFVEAFFGSIRRVHEVTLLGPDEFEVWDAAE